MPRFSPYIRRLILPLLACCLFSAPPDSNAVPVLKNHSKQFVTKASSSFSAARQPVIVGRYRDFTLVKKSVASRPHPSRQAQVGPVSARSIIIIDAVSGTTIFAREPDTPRQPASTIKVLTGMLAIDALRKGDRVPVSTRAARQPRSKIYLDHRRTYRANDLINAVLLASANDASVALAEQIAGSEHSFARMMTERAKHWGARNTVCKTASGLTARGQQSTARDLALIFRKAMQNREFASRMKQANIRTADGTLLHNHNKALWQVTGTQGGKTGYTNAARQTYVGKFKRGGDEIIIAIMGSETMWTDIKRLVAYGFSRKNELSATRPDSDTGKTAAGGTAVRSVKG